MSLAIGQTLSQYEILAPLGAGGMGEVWRAKDTRLSREVAIKVLPADVASDPDRLRRFEREARALASLSHPHVAQVYGIDEADGTAFMAMELVPGEDLSVRLARGPLPLDEALDVCRQIAEGLEAAHEAGVVHRDLKPANVQLTPDGRIKLLDFGLAKAVGPQPDSDQVSRAEPDSALLTEEGRVLGTPVYMSPEQARGRSIDRRTDLWALGCVLYECLTGGRPFAGRNPSDVIASILKDEPDWSALPPLPARVDELLRRCLQKDARMRLRDAGEARVQLVLAAAEPLGTGPVRSAPTGGAVPLRAVLVGVVGLALGAVLGLTLASDASEANERAAPGEVAAASPAPRRLRYTLTSFDEPTNLSSLVMSPAADAMAWTDRDGVQVRRLDELASRLLFSNNSMMRTSRLCWSPDGRELAWILDDGLWRMPLDGIEPIRVADLSGDDAGYLGMHWGEDGRLVMVQGATIVARSASSGASEVLYTAGEDPGFHFDGTTFLPDGQVLLLPHEPDGERDTVERIVDGRREEFARYEGWDILELAWAEDRLFLRTESESASRWWWVDCPPGASAPMGEPRPTPFTSDEVAFGPRGTVAWVSQEGRVESQLMRIGTDGTLRPLGRRHEGMVFPSQAVVDGRRLLFCVMFESGRESALWSHDLARGMDTFLTRPERPSPIPIALDDGRVILSSFAPEGAVVYPPELQGEPEPMPVDGMVVDATRDGTQVLIESRSDGMRAETHWDDLTDDQPPRLLRVNSQTLPRSARFSPDGRWLAYIGSESGENQAYLSAVPPGGREWQISFDGADGVWFSETGDAILLMRGEVMRGGSLELLRATFTPGDEPALGRPERLHTFEDLNLLIFGAFPDGDDMFGTLMHPPIAHDIVIETGWTPDD